MVHKNENKSMKKINQLEREKKYIVMAKKKTLILTLTNNKKK